MKWQGALRPTAVPLARLLRVARMIGERERVAAIGETDRVVGQTGKMEATVDTMIAHQEGEVSRQQEEESIKMRICICTFGVQHWIKRPKIGHVHVSE